MSEDTDTTDESIFDVESTTHTDAYDPDEDELDNEKRLYSNEESAAADNRPSLSQRGDSADEIDPRGLVRNPTLTEIRWYYRRTFASVLVNKPVEDAFKNGFDFMGTDDRITFAENLLDRTDFVENMKTVEKKARRDGFALLFIGTEDTTNSLAESPRGQVSMITHTTVLTIDDLSNVSRADIHDQVQTQYELTRDQYEVRETGIVINTDITSESYKEPIGYVLDQPNPKFIHADRIQHYVWNPEVDGDYNRNASTRRFHKEDTLGKWEGDSVLVKSYDLLKGLTKGNWSITQSLFRNAAHLYTAEMPEGADESDYDFAEKALTNLNAKSEIIHPNGIDVTQHQSGNALEPREYFDVLFDEICACHEMTKSVLFGTQSGTVSGSEVDIKNYFNKVERYRSNRATTKVVEFLTMCKLLEDDRTARTYEYDIDVEWKPMFTIGEEDRLEMLRTTVNAANMAINGYVMTPDEAREILTEDFAEIEFDTLTESQWDELDRLNLNKVGAYEGGQNAEEEMENPRRQNGGGMPEGNSTSEMADTDAETRAMHEHK
jgi:hypothetical protein